jgi:peptidoglycan/LPS O-acetylase OafA/YrhL
MKVLSSFWIVMGHRQAAFISTAFDAELPQGVLSKLINRSVYGVDTFFVCSAIVVTLSMLKLFETWVLFLPGSSAQVQQIWKII